jgi:hypothetical protein
MNLLDSVDNAQEHQTFVLDNFKNLKPVKNLPGLFIFQTFILLW